MKVKHGVTGEWATDRKVIEQLRREVNRLWSDPETFTSDTSMTREHYAVVLDGTSSSVDYTLLDSADVTGMVVWIKCKDATHTVRAVGTIDWASNKTLNTGDAVIMKAEGTSWLVFGDA